MWLLRKGQQKRSPKLGNRRGAKGAGRGVQVSSKQGKKGGVVGKKGETKSFTPVSGEKMPIALGKKENNLRAGKGNGIMAKKGESE